MHCNKACHDLMDCLDNHLGNNFENNAWDFYWDLEHNAKKLQEILNRTVQRIMSIITLALMPSISFFKKIQVSYLIIIIIWMSQIREDDILVIVFV